MAETKCPARGARLHWQDKVQQDLRLLTSVKLLGMRKPKTGILAKDHPRILPDISMWPPALDIVVNDHLIVWYNCKTVKHHPAFFWSSKVCLCVCFSTLQKISYQNHKVKGRGVVIWFLWLVNNYRRRTLFFNLLVDLQFSAKEMILDKEGTKDPVSFGRMKNSKRQGNLLKLMLAWKKRRTLLQQHHWINEVLFLNSVLICGRS